MGSTEASDGSAASNPAPRAMHRANCKIVDTAPQYFRRTENSPCFFEDSFYFTLADGAVQRGVIPLILFSIRNRERS